MKSFCLLSLKTPLLLLVSSFFALLLAACGGGGSGATPSTQLAALAPVPVPVPVPAEVPSTPDDAPHDALAAPDEGAETVPETDTSAAVAAADIGEAAFALDGYPPGWEIAVPPDPGQSTLPLAATGTGTTIPSAIYVSPRGADSNPGSAQRPFKSLARAARAAAAGSTVYVAPGEYEGGFRTRASGQPDARIHYVSTRRWGARIVPPAHSLNNTAWDNRGSHVDIIGFEIDGSVHRAGVRWTHGIYNGGSYDAIRNNWVHHIAQGAPCNRAGGSAIGIDSYFGGVQSDVIGNRVHDIGPAGCRFVQGIYVSTSGSIKNNVVFRVAEGAIHLWHDARDVIITNNTVSASNTGIIIGGGNFYRTSGPNDRTSVYSNIVVDNRMGISEQGRTGTGNSYRNNLVYRNALYNWQLRNGLGHTGTVSAAPRFVAADAGANPDFRLASGSPAIGQASATYAAPTDFDGRARNADTGYDIGAYQH